MFGESSGFFSWHKWIYTVAVIYFFHDDGREKRLQKTAKLSMENVQEFLTMKKKVLTMLVMCLAAVAMAEYTIDLKDDMKIRLGGDIRARYEGYTFNVAAPDVDKAGRHSTEYFRIRTRLWGAFDFGEDVTFNLRLANRFHYVTTSPNRNNNNGMSTCIIFVYNTL